MPKRLSSLPLLDFLSEQVECQYLSDLYSLTDLQKAKLALVVQSLVTADANLFEWNDAAAYITGGTGSFTTAEDAANAIIEYYTDTSQPSKEEIFEKSQNNLNSD